MGQFCFKGEDNSDQEEEEKEEKKKEKGKEKEKEKDKGKEKEGEKRKGKVGEAKKAASDLMPTHEYHTTQENATPEEILRAKGYQKREELGSGSFGTVYRMELMDGSSVACKIIVLGIEQYKQRAKNLKTELFVLTSVSHKNVVKLIDHFIIDDKVYIFMELASNGSLSSFIKKKRSLVTENRARKWFLQMCRGVHHMHSKGISHRDLKLGNILLNENMICKVTDFGLSRVTYRPQKGVRYCTSYGGTEPYIAPEIMRLNNEVGSAGGSSSYNPLIADIWALGVCLYLLLTKAYPFNTKNKKEMLSNQLNKCWKFERKERKRLSNDLQNLMTHLLDPDVNTRITFAGIFAHSWLESVSTDNDND